jgi:hypothetical protein
MCLWCLNMISLQAIYHVPVVPVHDITTGQIPCACGACGVPVVHVGFNSFTLGKTPNGVPTFWKNLPVPVRHHFVTYQKQNPVQLNIIIDQLDYNDDMISQRRMQRMYGLSRKWLNICFRLGLHLFSFVSLEDATLPIGWVRPLSTHFLYDSSQACKDGSQSDQVQHFGEHLHDLSQGGLNFYMFL